MGMTLTKNSPMLKTELVVRVMDHVGIRRIERRVNYSLPPLVWRCITYYP